MHQQCAARVDVAIIGAGISGLACASALLTKHNVVAVLEARKRIGGRLLSRDGVDFGASWSWPPHDERVGALSRQLGIDSIAQRLDGEAFHASADGGRAKAVGNVGSQMAPCGPGAVRFSGGYAALARALADTLPDGSLMTGCKVVSIAKSADGIRLAYERASGGQVEYVDARRVVVALPPGVGAATIDFEPPLPEAQRRKMASTSTWCGDWCKLVAHFRTPFWRALGASGVVATAGPVQIWWEGGGGPELGEASSALVGLGVGEACRAFAPMQIDGAAASAEGTPEPLKQYVVRALGPAYGSAVEEQLVSASVKTWIADGLTYASAGSHRDYGHALLRQPTAWGVHFAGTESEARNGHVEGALAAAERVAKEVLEAMASGG